MRSSLISGGLLRSHIGRYMALWVAFAAAWLLCLVLPLAVLAPSAASKVTGAFQAGWSAEYVGALIGCAVASLYSACCVFEYLFNRPAALFAGSLPVSRTALFATSYVAGLLPLLVIELVVFGIISGMTVLIPAIGFRYCVTWLGLTAGFTFVFYNVAVLCALLSGTKTMTYYLFVLANSFIILIEVAFRIIASSIMWGVSYSGIPALLWTSPIFGMGYYCLSFDGGYLALTSSTAWIALALYCLTAVAMLACSLALNKRRNLEVAGNMIVVRGMGPAAKIMGGFAFAIVVGMIALFLMQFGDESQLLEPGQCAVLAIACFVGALLGVFFAQHSVVGGGHALKRSARTGACIGLVCILFVVGCFTDVLHVKRWVPKVDDVESVTVSMEMDDATLASEEAISSVMDAHAKILAFEHCADDNSFYTNQVRLSYKLKNGSSVERTYELVIGVNDELARTSESGKVAEQGEKVFEELEKVSDSKEGVASRLAPILEADASAVEANIRFGKLDKYGNYLEEYELQHKEIEDFVQNALKTDVEQSGLGRVYRNDGKTVGELVIYVEDNGLRSFDFYLTTKNCPAVAKWMKKHYGVDILG